ncbi:glycoside hydrolase family 26 protein [Clostridium aminobutyricum]|uniref:Endoglucanase n=1 Tax=Clostridium aminobutyricum TaxID=33953 RepID=A0A939D6F4_CLOAM|nr:glycosyl hydrolase [Clostridium aminobutyricum]MBN7771960.1 endoglucanase [Clostridium aminobutyricum]
MKKIIAVMIGLVMMFSTAATVFAAEGTPAQYSLTDTGTYDYFTNYVDGYSLYIDKNMKVDMSYSSVGTMLENSNKRIEIYKQSLSGTSKTGYINYSNKFLSNTADHHLEYEGVQTMNGYNANIVVWNRDKLSRVDNDMNYYLCMDVQIGSYCYTFFIKSTDPIGMMGGYTYLLDAFSTFTPTMAPYTRVSQAVDVDDKNWNDETKEFYNKYFGLDSELTWGIFEPQTAGYDYTMLDYYENYFEYEFPILLNYSEFTNKTAHPDLKQRLDTAYANGKALELTLQTNWQADGNMVYDILDGEYDDFLSNYAQVVAEFGHPVLFRLGNEMNGDWCPYSSYNTSRDTMIYKEFYKYVYSFFEQEGAQNVIWIWNPNCASFPGFNWNHELMYYPGDEYVDVIGMTAYNTGTYYASSGEKWHEFDELYNNLYYTYSSRYQQPLMITEFASASMGGDKNQWVIDMFNTISHYNRIKVAVWWDGCDWDKDGNVARSYIMDESVSLLDIFKKYLKEPWYRGTYA